MLDRRENVEPCHTNTCQWILDLGKYQSWRREPRGLLWIKGKPGAGKSTLMVFLHGELRGFRNQGIQLDFFFTARGTEMQRTPLGMLRSLLSQIFDRDATIRPQIRETYEQRCRQFGYGESKWEWPQLVLEELLASVILASACRQHVTVFVDALDEAGTDSAQQLAAYFHRLIDRAEKKNAAIRICISCRHYPIIGGAQAMEIHVEQHNHKDIATYIKDTLTEVEDDHSEDMRQILMEQLIQQVNGVFQWARLMIPLARQAILEGESFDDICCWLREVPADLEDVYLYILNHVLEARNLEQSFLLFQWVCLAERPLTTWEKINGFVESDERMKRRIRALSGGLVEVVSSGALNENVQVVHQSVNDFLRAKGLAALSDNIGSSSPVLGRESILLQCQANLYRSCLVYLALLPIRGDFSSDSQGKKEELIQKNPLLAYATGNLFIHAEKAAHSRGLLQLNEQDILQQILGQWVRTYQILDPFNPACPPMNTTIVHMAAAANLLDIIERVSLNSEDLATEDANGNTAFHLAARYGHIAGGRILRQKAVNCESTNGRGKTPLIEAASYGHTEFVEWLLLEGVKLEGRVGKGGSALQSASLGGHQSVVEVLLAAGADVNAQGGEYGNALQAAAYRRNSEIVQMFLDAGADVNALGGRYGSALKAAAAAAYKESSGIVQILLNAGADVNARGGEYGNALQTAANGRNSEIVQMLLDAGADVNAQGGRYGNALKAATAAAYKESSGIVQILLNAGANVNARGGEYGNALQTAIFVENSEIVQMLLDAGADFNAQGGEYGNALQAATYGENSEIVQMLLDAGADVNAQGGRYGNALQAAAAATHEESSEIVQILLDAGADVNAWGGEYGNALQAAAHGRNSEIVQILLDAGADVNAQGGRYGNALQATAAAAYKQSSGIVQILLNAGANINAQGGEFGNALQAAAHRRNSRLVQMLLDAGANINAQGGRYGNALQAATFKGNSKIVQMLLDAGADVNAQGGEYGNALRTAAYGGNSQTVQMLLDAGAVRIGW
ncbi:hypothetical protein N7513_006110 [Penicillium frequentans]|nr:hypothetical protein N7513_006110 [Penicillium glabrum]